MVLAGRGFGKTRIGAETILDWARTGKAKRIALISATARDYRQVMVEGESGILNCALDSERPTYEPSKCQLTWPNGCIATCYASEEPERLRGPQHDAAWCDELAAWRYDESTWAMLQFGMRLGRRPRAVITTTPRPSKLIRRLVAEPSTHVTRGSTFENKANLAAPFIEEIVRLYEGTRLGRQELYAEILDDSPGALWKREWIDAKRVVPERVPDFRRCVVAIDPAVTSNADSDETGIIVAGLGADGRGYIVADYSGIYSPEQWGRRAVKAFRDWRADHIICEVNNGGDLVKANLMVANKADTDSTDANKTTIVPVREVRASRGKQTRAEPVAALYEQGRVSHVGTLGKLEDQLCVWDPSVIGSRSPDRLDALVWALTDLMVGPTTSPQVRPESYERQSCLDEGSGW